MAATTASTRTVLKLLDSGASPYAQKVRIALREKGIPFECITPSGIGTGAASTDLDKYSLRREVPTLIVVPTTSSSSSGADAGATQSVSDSATILEYIEDAYPSQTPLRATSAFDRARARELEMTMTSAYEPITWAYAEIVNGNRIPHNATLKERLIAKAKADAKQVQYWLEDQLAQREYFHADGAKFGYADIVVAPFIQRSMYHGLGPQRDSQLGQWLDRIQQRASVKKTFEEFDAAIEGLMTRLGNFTSEANANKPREEKAKRLYRDHRLEWLIKSGAIDAVKDAIDQETVRFAPLPDIDLAKQQ